MFDQKKEKMNIKLLCFVALFVSGIKCGPVPNSDSDDPPKAGHSGVGKKPEDNNNNEED